MVNQIARLPRIFFQIIQLIITPTIVAVFMAPVSQCSQRRRQAMATKEFDVVISDWTMAGMSGLDIIEQIKQKHPQTITILMTGWEIKNSIVEDHQDIDLTISKPFSQSSLNQALAKAHQIQQKNHTQNLV